MNSVTERILGGMPFVQAEAMIPNQQARMLTASQQSSWEVGQMMKPLADCLAHYIVKDVMVPAGLVNREYVFQGEPNETAFAHTRVWSEIGLISRSQLTALTTEHQVLLKRLDGMTLGPERAN